MSIEEIKKYDTFIYHGFNVAYVDNLVKLEFDYEIKDLEKFKHKIEIPYSINNINKKFVDKLVFNIGLLEAVSYYKATVAKKLHVLCGSLNNEQKEFFKKIYFHGLGEFFYLNNLNPNYEDFLEISCSGPEYNEVIDTCGNGSLIAIGGGKDSCVSLSLVKKDNNSAFIINPKSVSLDCAKEAGYSDESIICVKRTIDVKLLKLNELGFLNGHTPFSAMVAFVSYLSAYLNGKNEIVLSNESSANEANVIGTNINHQYSKSYEFEEDFTNYASKYLGGNIKYFSLLRPLSEYQIGMIFAREKKYHKIFKSCNVGSKSLPWVWCCNCAKCLFVFSLLSPHLYKDDLVNIFGSDLFENKKLLNTFLELLGKQNVKPFDCVGTFEEINYAITKTIKNYTGELPYLLKYYKDNYYDEEILKLDLEHKYNDENNLSDKYKNIIMEAIK